MASQTPGGQSKKLRHRITDIKLQPSTSNYDISLKVLVDGQEVHRLPAIRRESNSRVEIRVYEKHLLGRKRVGSLEYTVSTVVNQAGASLEFDTKQFTALISFPTPEEATQAPATALAGAQVIEKKTGLLERLGSTRNAFKTILLFSGAVAEVGVVSDI
ncbi:hypothetical protein BDV93DRAFT_505923 [Ceratobasidium sp. AG-I]|nr:hypothetical protein BDV93DRAFT_505923 [Ceratobasidium sp. AG-I]